MGVALDGPAGSKWYTAAEAAEILGVERNTVNQWVRRKQITRRSFGAVSAFNSRDLERFILERDGLGMPKLKAPRRRRRIAS